VVNIEHVYQWFDDYWNHGVMLVLWFLCLFVIVLSESMP
jgi:hypothetical protein